MASKEDHIASGRAAAGHRECALCGEEVRRIDYPDHIVAEHSA